MKPALVLVDLQQDFLHRPGLEPPAGQVTAAVAALRAGCRQRLVPVIHVHTVVRADGSDRMPHWIRDDFWACVDGTPGAATPPGLAPATDEVVIHKPFFSGFGNPALQDLLQRQGIDTLIVAGIYLHGCVRSTVLDAYERGYEVWVADDAVGSTEPAHAAASRAWLASRAASFMATADIFARLDSTPTPTAP
jgi:nicotinamidase-related amidase